MSSPAAWHPDPLGRHEHRYWDGTRWTEHVANGGQSGTDPLEAASSGTSGDASQPVTSTERPADEAASASPAATTPSAGPAGDPQSPQEPSPSQGAGWANPAAQQPAQQHAAPQATWQAGAPSGQAPPTNGLAVAAMIIGILSLLIAWIPFVGLLGVVGGALALLLGLLGRGRAKKIANGAALAITGIVTGLLAVLVGIVSTVLPVLFFQGMIGDFEAVDRCIEETGDEDACIEEHAPGWVRFLDGIED